MYRQEEVERGIALLDARKPEWRESFNPDTLDTADVSECVLGQAFGSYTHGLVFLNLLGTGDAPADYGFALPVLMAFDDDDSTYGEAHRRLTGTWVALTK